MEYCDFKVFIRVLCQFTTKFAPFAGVPRVNRGDTPESRWINLKVGIQCVLFSVGYFNDDILFLSHSCLSRFKIKVDT